MASLTHRIFASLKAGGSPTPMVSETHNAGAGVSATPSASSASPTTAWNERFYHVAVQGCCHGELDRIYDACTVHERQSGKRIDVLICCGDFQAVRTAGDMDSMAVPDKFKVMGDFHKYWSAVTAPYLTIFVGGNHENSDLLAQESYGGFVAPNIYYLGHSGLVTVDNCLRVAGLSGIFKEQDYDLPYPPRPYAANYGWKKGAYHVRRIEVAKLHTYLRAAQILRQSKKESSESSDLPLVDIFVSHDWPVGITAYGDEAQLLRFKPYFRDDIRRHALGNPHTMNLLREAKPVYWVAAHLHCFFEATVSHTFARSSDDAKGGAEASPAPTRFVALDKCAKGSGFLTFLDLPRRPRCSTATSSAAVAGTATKSDLHDVDGAARIQRDPLWVEVLLASHPYVAANQTTKTSSSTQGASSLPAVRQRCFDVNDTVREIVARHSSGSPANEPLPAAALASSSTAALLKELELSPTLPLQQQDVALSSSSATASMRYGQGRQSAAQWAVSRADDISSRDLHRHHPRQRTEVSTAPPVVEAAPATAAAPLSFFEDVGTATPFLTAPAPTSSSTASDVKPAPAPLGWYEDTTM
ncbi:hypothetical protein ABB37_07955 [Leptomonas pyrrhocoris]|uniref:Lariat debranching enzyme C-terminal domain-containing protein n=1 Tax=Leptomonas pyrrhocoris TaxID=157538 RepID=A0A0N1J4F6_LEPPY|nr:hypothetical protein ABB37_07955 [Leptomonas pyrrhocoris]KPA76201.1 hypothetical protein ABB37_07955 [Leptomonas pyrrhocoris]|eukprot:XP_015654640.1 hypothetical protein ABB37_07955 [Leptomonas pyrrhocoris]